MAKSILHQLHDLVNQGHTLEAAIEQIIPGADPEFWRSKIAKYDPTQPAAPKSRKNRRKGHQRTRRSKFNAASVLSTAEIQTRARHAATAELVERVNTPEDGPQPDPQGGYVVLVNGEPMAWTDDPAQAERSYHELVDEPIVWNVAGQTRELEVQS